MREDPQDQRRVAAMDQVAMAELHLRGGQVDQAETEANAALKADPSSADAAAWLFKGSDERISGVGPWASR